MKFNKFPKINCIGDKIHNDIINKVFLDVNMKLIRNKNLISQIEKILPENSWIFQTSNCIDKSRAIKLNKILKSKSIQEFKENVKKFIEYLEKPRSAILNEKMIDVLRKFL